MGTELPTKVVLGQTLVLIQMTFLNSVRRVGRLVLSRTSCFEIDVNMFPVIFLILVMRRANIADVPTTKYKICIQSDHCIAVS
jgi:hypothetical protein